MRPLSLFRFSYVLDLVMLNALGKNVLITALLLLCVKFHNAIVIGLKCSTNFYSLFRKPSEKLIIYHIQIWMFITRKKNRENTGTCLKIYL